jgi:hypothetical protein
MQDYSDPPSMLPVDPAMLDDQTREDDSDSDYEYEYDETEYEVGPPPLELPGAVTTDRECRLSMSTWT